MFSPCPQPLELSVAIMWSSLVWWLLLFYVCDESFVSHSRCAFSETTRWPSPHSTLTLMEKRSWCDNEDFVDRYWSICPTSGNSYDGDEIGQFALKDEVSIIIIGELQSGACPWLQDDASQFYLELLIKISGGWCSVVQSFWPCCLFHDLHQVAQYYCLELSSELDFERQFA